MRCDLGHLLLVLEELGRGGLLEGGRQRGDRVVVRAALMSGKTEALIGSGRTCARAGRRGGDGGEQTRGQPGVIKRKKEPRVCVRQSSAVRT